MNPMALPHQMDQLDRTAEAMAGKMAPLARILRPLVAHTVARLEAEARMARPMRRHWASRSPPG